MPEPKVIVIGLDCATPQLLFDAYRADLPNISRMMEQGTWGKMESTVPPITVPAWMSMMTSKDPGALGVYGFRSRKAGSDYKDMDIANGRLFTGSKKLWDYLGEAGKKSRFAWDTRNVSANASERKIGDLFFNAKYECRFHLSCVVKEGDFGCLRTR
jgi:predicted AlkP superfamily phosphohydrolase/phosphomutase